MNPPKGCQEDLDNYEILNLLTLFFGKNVRNGCTTITSSSRSQKLIGKHVKQTCGTYETIFVSKAGFGPTRKHQIISK